MVKKKWFSSLAISMGIAALPGQVEAQYVGNGTGLGASSFQLPPLPASRTPQAASGIPTPGTYGSMVHPTNYRQVGANTIGSGVPNPTAAYQDPYSIGNLAEIESVQSAPQIYSRPSPPPPSHVNTAPEMQGHQYGQQFGHQSHEHSHTPQLHPGNPHAYAAPALQYQGPQAPCPACAAGACATHGVGTYYSGHPFDGGPVYGLGAGNDGYYDCGASAVGLTTAVSPSPWIFGAGGLLFNRVDDYNRKLASSGPTEWLGTGDAAMRATGGFQGSVGRYFGCGRYALVGTYWGIFSDPQMVTITPGAGHNIRTNLPFTPISPPGDPMPWYGAYMPGGNRHIYDWYDSGSSSGTNNPATHSQRLRRDNEFHNVELNLFTFALGGGARQGIAGTGCQGHGGGLWHHGGHHGGHCGYSHGGQCGYSCGPSGNAGWGTNSCCPNLAGCGTGLTGPCAPWYGAQCSRLRLNTFGGLRWFRFGDELEYASSQTDNMYGTTDDDFYYVSNVTNDLVGVQLGTLATWCTGHRFNFFGGTNFGVYNNHIRTYTRAGTTMTDAMIRPLGSPGEPDVAYNFRNSLNDVAFIGEGTLGTGILIKPGWTLNLGYRVVGVAGVATSVGQIPTEFTHVSSIRGIKNDRSLILHGAVFGMNYNF